ncbi:MAG: PRC-barrel domain-containing protein [Akkermansiaceae bacterium]|nr:PRC-barrel domain-containing protein [Akkermansiaceae bacterium]
MQRSLILSLLSLFTPLTSFADADKQAELIAPIPGTKGNASSWRASQVMGLKVKNAGDETIGEVEDLILDMKSGEILAVVISSGGFLGIADTLSAVPVSILRYDTNANAFKTKLTKEQLTKAPQFKSNEWPDYNEGTSTEKLRNYRESFDDDQDDDSNHTAPDNSAQNKKERNKNGMMPTDQGTSDKDLQITKGIRVDIMAADLSFDSKNIKIITKDEHVYLKGVVENHSEHQAILEIAKNHAGSDKIIDELTMKSK